MEAKTILYFLILGILSFAGLNQLQSQQLAFPGAEGYGKYTVGGRGGQVIEVTNLNASGAGSLRAACEASGSRTVVFRVAGTIDTDISISNDYITIAGQTAPGDGITIKGTLSINASNVIIRYIRVRAEAAEDAVTSRGPSNIILDHVSASWSGDEVMSLYRCDNITIQWCMITEACSSDHRFGGIWGGNYNTYHHNLIAHNESRNIRWASGCQNNDYRNNVIYNWGYASCYGAEKEQPGDSRYNFSNVNMIANYYKPGPGTESGVRSEIADPSSRNGDADAGKWWISDNFMEGSAEVTADNWKGVTETGSAYRLSAPWPAMPIAQQTAEEAYESVLEHAGCSFPNRDVIDARIIDEVRNGTASKGDNGFVSTPSIAGGWPQLASGTAPTDSDSDGIPDSWEVSNQMNPNSQDSNGDNDGDGYTNLEEYLDWILNGNTTSYLLTTTVNGQGSVSPASGSFNQGSTISLTAQAASGWSFSSWSGDLSGNANPAILTMNGDKTVTANFTQLSGSFDLKIEEDEPGFCGVDGSIDSNNIGFTGNGFANTNNTNGAGVDWSVNVPSDGTYTLKWKYANGGSGDRLAQVIANGTTVAASISMPNTGGWTTWTETPSVNVTLQAGTTALRLQATTPDGLANIDYVIIGGVNPSAAACSGSRVSITSEIVEITDNHGIVFYPVPVDGVLTIQFSTTDTESAEVYLLDATGRVIKSSKTTGPTHKVDLSELPGGAYFIRISGKDLNVVKHIMKQ